jgi:hypothetical protein
MIGSTIVVINNTARETTEGNVVLAVAGITLLVVIGVFVIGSMWRRWSNRK